ncbi:MAG TPA: 2-oxoglutarate oxidoreductase [Caldithrix abyssi]|uniref:2-oxoglutarate oxidoreductase n=1 Tax=Caldithrix abyssi TaxID=187145 RepID=A0A7V5RPX2_CALAY|nr:2-oxoglutarate oxidoreductase [Caldithrix abyssi]
MFGVSIDNLLNLDQKYYEIDDYQSDIPRWCPGCGDNGILTATQRLLREEQIAPEKTVFVSGIGCSSRFPHYMNTYGFHSLHGRALPIAEGIKIRRPDLHVFVNMGDGDCFSIGAAHWIHALRYNMNMVAMVHDNNIYGLTKKQASPTTPKGLKSNTTPRGAVLEPLNPLVTTLAVSNVSFVANVVEWIPDLLFDVIKKAFHHKGFSFIRILQRCPHFTPHVFDPIMNEPDRLRLLTHDDGMVIPDAIKKIYKNVETHDPSNIHKAREYASDMETIPIGILFRDESIPTYDDIRKPTRPNTPSVINEALQQEFDKFGIKPKND